MDSYDLAETSLVRPAVGVPTSVRPATASDAAVAASHGLSDLLPDRWRPGGNRRSFVALGPDERPLGHCRGIDNEYHPASRTCVLEVAVSIDDPTWIEIADALLSSQIGASTLPLIMKPSADEPQILDLCAKHGGVITQLMPPWRYTVGPAMRAWAETHRVTRDGLSAVPARAASLSMLSERMLDLHVEHYSAQHERWSPASPPALLRQSFAASFDDEEEDALDPARSMVLVRGDVLSAQAIAWPPDTDGNIEIGLEHRSYEGSSARQDMEACLAGLIDLSTDGDVFLIDSHITEEVESSMIRELRRFLRMSGDKKSEPRSTEIDEDEPWSAIVAIPVPGGPLPMPLSDAARSRALAECSQPDCHDSMSHAADPAALLDVDG